MNDDDWALREYYLDMVGAYLRSLKTDGERKAFLGDLGICVVCGSIDCTCRKETEWDF